MSVNLEFSFSKQALLKTIQFMKLNSALYSVGNICLKCDISFFVSAVFQLKGVF